MKKALGKGLDALIPKKEETLLEIEIERIIPNKSQPRAGFDENSLRELAQSIKEKGIIQPVVVSRVGDGTFRLIAGERRWRAAKLAGVDKIPAIIKDVSPAEAVEIALIENIQREDLDPVETASAFERLLNEFSSNPVLGCAVPGIILSISISSNVSSFLGIRASNPLPSAFFT